MKLYIFRHAQARESGQEYAAEILSADIHQQGIPPIERMGNFLKNKKTDYNVSSPYKRCKQTVGIISKITGKKFNFDARLDEFYLETFEEFKNRVESFITDIKKYNAVAICTHAAVIQAIIRLINGKSLNKSDLETNLPLPGVLLIVEGRKVEEIDFNK